MIHKTSFMKSSSKDKPFAQIGDYFTFKTNYHIIILMGFWTWYV